MRDEIYYQAFALGLLNCLTSTYYVRSEYRGGKGPFAIIELKDEDKSVDDATMQNVADGALKQIWKLRYFAVLHGEIHLYGIATRQTDVSVPYKRSFVDWTGIQSEIFRNVYAL